MGCVPSTDTQQVRAAFAAAGDGVVVGLRWRESTSGTQQEMFQVLRLEAGKVVGAPG